MLAQREQLVRDYEDRLRALGWFLDREQLCRVSLTVNDDDFLLLVRSREAPDEDPRELRFNGRGIESLRASALRRRGQGTSRASFRPSRLTALHERQATDVPLSAWLEESRALPYQELFRIIGRDLDLCHARAFRIDERPTCVRVRVRLPSNEPDIYQVFSLPREELRVRIATAVRLRKLRSAAS